MLEKVNNYFSKNACYVLSLTHKFLETEELPRLNYILWSVKS